MTDATAVTALRAGRPRSWADLREVAGPLTAGQRWTAVFVCGATALFLAAGLPGTRTVVDDSVTGSLEPAITAPAASIAPIDSGAPVPAADFFNQPTPTTVPPPTSTSTPSGTGDGGSTNQPPPPSGGQPAPPAPLPIPVPLPVPIPGLGG